MATGLEKPHSETLHVQPREGRGTRQAQRLRSGGYTPAVLYGHGQTTVSLAVPSGELDAALRRSRLVSLEGAVNETALIREVQWDTFGTHVLHVDLFRVSETESVEVTVALELRGEAPGVREGGILQQPVHEIDIECPVAAIPEKIYVSVRSLHVGDALHASDLELPQGARLITDPDTLVLRCELAVPVVEEELVVPGAEGAEPEVIGRKPTEEEAAE